MNKVQKLASLASEQWGLITTAQAKQLGVSRLDMSRMQQSGRLERLAHGVYKNTGVPSDEFESIRAAWISLDPGHTASERIQNLPHEAVVCLESAAWLLRAGDFVPEPYRFSTPQRKQTQRKDLQLRVKLYPPESVQIVEGLPVTTFEQTVADLVEAGMDISLVQNTFVNTDINNLKNLNLNHLDSLLAPLANRNGFRAEDGEALRQELMAPYMESVLKIVDAVNMQPLQKQLVPILSGTITGNVASHAQTPIEPKRKRHHE